MDTLRLRFDPTGDEHPLPVGVHGVGHRPGSDSLGLVDGSPLVNVCVDRRGVWLTVPDGTRGVHVNGRPVRRMALLRVGDAVFVDGHGMRLVAATRPREPATGLDDGAGDAGDVRVVLRGVGGRYHGRSFTLDRPRLVGRAAEADIRIDEAAFAERHARVWMVGNEVVLRDLGSAEGSQVNGELVRDAVLRPGDQIVFDAHHRFVLEAPSSANADGAGDDAPVPQPEPEAPPRGGGMRLPWLLLAALLMAGLLALLLLFGAG